MMRKARQAATVLALAASAWNQETVNPLNLGRHQDVSPRAMALGGSFTGVANDFSALFYNPAGLTSVRKHEAHFALEWTGLLTRGRADGFPSRTDDQRTLGIQSFGLVLPVPTERGGLSFALGAYSPRTFSDLLVFEDALSPQRGTYQYRAEGDLTHYRAAVAVELSPDAVFGLAIGYLHGEEQIDIQDVPASRYLRAYDGFNLEPSLLFKITPRWRIGVSLVALERFVVHETFQQPGSPALRQEYRVRHPLQLKLGVGYQGLGYLIAADYKAFNWSQYRIGVASADFLENPDFDDEHGLSLGAEKILLPWPVTLRGGYATHTLVGPGLEPAYNIHRGSAGVGFLLGAAVDLSGAYSLGFWEARSGAAYSEHLEHRVLLGFSYRF